VSGWRVLADATVAIHILALIYIGLGGFLAWRWPKAALVHIFFAFWGIAVNVFPLACPLTSAEDFFRAKQGLGPLPGGFNAYYLYDTVIPRAMLPLVAVTAVTLVVVSYVGAWQRYKHRDDAPTHRVRQA
jgi:hypothetical protein